MDGKYGIRRRRVRASIFNCPTLSWGPLVSRTTTRKRFSQYQVVRAREPASFWRSGKISVSSEE